MTQLCAARRPNRCVRLLLAHSDLAQVSAIGPERNAMITAYQSIWAREIVPRLSRGRSRPAEGLFLITSYVFEKTRHRCTNVPHRARPRQRASLARPSVARTSRAAWQRHRKRRRSRHERQRKSSAVTSQGELRGVSGRCQRMREKRLGCLNPDNAHLSRR